MRKRLRIIQVVNVRWFNATAWYGLTLSRLLKDAGHEVLVLGLSGTDSFAKAEEWGLSPFSINLNTANPVLFSLALRKARALVRDFRPDIVNCHRGEGVIIWGLLKAGGYPFALVRTRGDQRPPKNNVANRRLHGRTADALIATNSRTAAQLSALTGEHTAPVHTILGGVDTYRFAPSEEKRAAFREKYGFGENDFVVGLLGRFDPVKGHKELVEAAAMVKNGCVPGYASPVPGAERLKLLFLGYPAQFSGEDITGMLHEEGLNGVVTGKVNDVVAAVNAMDVGVVASQGSEAIARAAFEIMGCGVPLISTDVGVMPDLLAPWAMAPMHDAGRLAGLLARALAEPAFRSSLLEAQHSLLPSLTLESFLEKTLQVYYDVLPGTGSQ